jgi:hypothetical protein
MEESLTKSKIKLLKPQDSIAVTVNENSLGCYDTLFTTNFNIYIRRNQQVMPFVNLFDDSIESLSSSDDEIVIKFKNDDRIYRSNNLIEAENFLSSGTIKGSNLITYAMMVMQTGGYLIVDEIENHLHKKLVQTIINLFNDNKINRNGATLIFSTHYSEKIDCLNRKDNIFIMLRNNKYISSAVRYSKLVKRNDVKKSEVLISNYIDGTAPNYESIKLVREMLCGFRIANNRLLILCICEGLSELVTINMLLDNDMLVFKRDQLISGEPVKRESVTSIQDKYLNYSFDKPLYILRIIDSKMKNLS